MLKIFKITFNDGGWHNGDLPSTLVIAEGDDMAILKARKEFYPTVYSKWDAWAKEITFEGYKITINKLA